MSIFCKGIMDIISQYVEYRQVFLDELIDVISLINYDIENIGDSKDWRLYYFSGYGWGLGYKDYPKSSSFSRKIIRNQL